MPKLTDCFIKGNPSEIVIFEALHSDRLTRDFTSSKGQVVGAEFLLKPCYVIQLN